MYEKVNPAHPDKVADRIAGAIVDLCYEMQDNPKVAVEVLIGHGVCTIITEASVLLDYQKIQEIVWRIAKVSKVELWQAPQDEHLAENQNGGIKCGDNGIFKGAPVTDEQRKLTNIAKEIYEEVGTDGKYILNAETDDLIICQSCVNTAEFSQKYINAYINPLGDWKGGTDVDTGATNRKLGSDMGDSITGGGLHGKDLSKADVSVNIYAWLKAQKEGRPVEMCCAIGDSEIDGKPYSEIVEVARQYIEEIGGFEKFAEWGLIR